ncbi:hypothetical protein [Dyella flagellata]|uniref:Uncharacterized protein n=1 Tax=Dyella flagellata TaxID=1867833 RepID=A0ABQ5X8B7_9GAMM|nr:hypothetical protein [Dyella flagellata]GLQ87869.1 hypothetical protein GCM10007898_14370 [Dyella flagellata]
MSAHPISSGYVHAAGAVANGGISRAEANERVRNALNEFQNQVSPQLADVLCNCGNNSEGYLEVLARVLGDKLNTQADKLKYDAAHVNSADPGQTTELSAEAEEFSQMMDAFNNVIKTLGEALDTMVRKQ